MNIKNKKGFTLIELLAVIVILAIIALIATPLILGVIEEARLNSFKNTGYGIIKSGEIKLAEEMMKPNGKKELNIVFPNNDSELSYKGTKPENGILKIDEKGKVTLKIISGKMCAYSKGDEVIAISNNSKNQTEWDANCDLDNNESETSILPGVDKPLVFDKNGVNDDGLYKAEDLDFEYDYIYRGANPDNYLLFGGSCFRIMNVGKPGDYSVKIVYASDSNGDGTCQVQKNGIIVKKAFNSDGTQLWQNSELKTDFESWYYNSTTTPLYGKLQLNKKEKESIKLHRFSVGKGYYYGEEKAPTNLKDQIKLEKEDETGTPQIYTGHVGLPNISDHIGASLNPLCNVKNSYNDTEPESNNKYPCKETRNYVATDWTYWSMNPSISVPSGILSPDGGGDTGSVFVSTAIADIFGVRPVIYLESDVQFDGLGKIEEPFILKK